MYVYPCGTAVGPVKHVGAWEALSGAVTKDDERLLLGRKRRRLTFAAANDSVQDEARHDSLAMQATVVRSGASAVTQTWYPTGEDEVAPIKGAC
eukprot:SAG11_NODE_652_length_7925_cov_3.950166_15_plen_94_part_00